MDFFNKAVDKYASSTNDQHKTKKSDSTYAKAMEAAEKYHVKDKAVQYAQKQVAKRGEPGYVEKKDKSAADKAREAAEDYLAKQGQQQQPHHSETGSHSHKHDNQKDDQKADYFGMAKKAYGQYSKKH